MGNTAETWREEREKGRFGEWNRKGRKESEESREGKEGRKRENEEREEKGTRRRERRRKGTLRRGEKEAREVEVQTQRHSSIYMLCGVLSCIIHRVYEWSDNSSATMSVKDDACESD